MCEQKKGSGSVLNQNFQEAQKEAVRLLAGHGIADAAADAWYLMEYVTGMDRTKYLLEKQKPMESSAWEAYFDFVRRRAEHVPLQYLTGEQYFMGFRFSVSRHVLIPRQDTEVLAEEAVRYLRGREAESAEQSEHGKNPKGVLDL